MSYKKLQDLLNTGSQGGRDPQWFAPQNNKSPSITQSQFSPLGTHLVSGATRSPSYHSIPSVQNMFYHPPTKNQIDPVCPSPMFQVPAKKNTQALNSLFQGSRFTAAETNPSNNHSILENNNASNSINSLINQLQSQLTNQPKNLEELLQKSFSSLPSNSMVQSPFTSSMQSPFMGGNNHNSQIQPSIGSEISNLLAPMTLLETSLQSNNLLGNQSHKNQQGEAVNKALVLQLAQILKQESESKIKSAIAELILKYRALGLLNNLSGNEMLDLQSLIKGAETPQNHNYQYQNNHQEVMSQPNLFSLSCGLPMNSVPRNDMAHSVSMNDQQGYKQCLQPTKIDAARRELFAMNEVPLVRQPSADSFSRNAIQGSIFQPSQNHLLSGPLSGFSSSPINVLDQEMNSLTLSTNMNHNHFNTLGITSTISAPEKMEDLANEDLGSILKNQVPSDEELPGVYNKYERINKILKYKNKIRKWRRQHPVKRVFKGRSLVAGQKPRIKGKFVTLEEYSQYIHTSCKNEYNDGIKEEYY